MGLIISVFVDQQPSVKVSSHENLDWLLSLDPQNLPSVKMCIKVKIAKICDPQKFNPAKFKHIKI